MEAYSVDFHGHYPEQFEQLIPTYLAAVPRCPKSRRVYQLSIGPDSPFNTAGFVDFYYVYCSGSSHVEEGFGRNSPGLNGVEAACPVR